jgi:hypothetical protein
VLRVWRILLYAASFALVAAAALEAAGPATSVGNLTGLDSAAIAALRALRVCFAAQCLAVSGLLVTASVRPQSVGRSALFWCGLLPAVEALVLAPLLGLHPLPLLLGAASLAVFGAILTRPTRQSSAGVLG